MGRRSRPRGTPCISEPKGAAGKVKNEFDLEISLKLTTEGTENTEKCKIALYSLWFFNRILIYFYSHGGTPPAQQLDITPPKHPSPLRTQSPQEESKSACQPPHQKGRRSIPGGAPCISEHEGAEGELKKDGGWVSSFFRHRFHGFTQIRCYIFHNLYILTAMATLHNQQLNTTSQIHN